MKSEPKEVVFTLVCFLDIQYIGAMLRYTRKPVRERRVIESPAWSASTKARMTKPNPRGAGMLEGNSSSMFRPNSVAVQSFLQTGPHRSQDHLGQRPSLNCDTSSDMQRCAGLGQDVPYMVRQDAMTSSTLLSKYQRDKVRPSIEGFQSETGSRLRQLVAAPLTHQFQDGISMLMVVVRAGNFSLCFAR